MRQTHNHMRRAKGRGGRNAIPTKNVLLDSDPSPILILIKYAHTEWND